MKNYLLLVFLMATLFSCDFSKRLDTTAVVKEMKMRQVKRILLQDIVNQVDTWGQELQKNMEKGIAKDQFDAYQIKQMAQKYEVSILIGKPSELMVKTKDKKLKETLDALGYSLEMKQDVPPSIQKNSKGDSLYYLFINPKKALIVIGFAKSKVIQNMDLPLIK